MEYLILITMQIEMKFFSKKIINNLKKAIKKFTELIIMVKTGKNKI